MVEPRSKPTRILAACVVASLLLGVRTASAAEPAEGDEAGPHVRIEVKRGKTLSLYGVESEFVGMGAGSGGTVAVHGISFRRLCISPCDKRVRSRTGSFFLGGGSYSASRRFELPDEGDVVVKARAGHKALYWLGWVSVMLGLPMLLSGATLAGLKVGSKGLHGGLIGGGSALILGSIPLFIFGRTRAKVGRR